MAMKIRCSGSPGGLLVLAVIDRGLLLGTAGQEGGGEAIGTSSAVGVFSWIADSE